MKNNTTISSSSDSSRNCQFEAVTCSENIGDAAKLLLQALGVLKNDDTAGAYLGDLFYANNAAAERSFCCGGGSTHGAYAGVFFLSGISARSYSSAYFGFRSAFVKLPTA